MSPCCAINHYNLLIPSNWNFIPFNQSLPFPCPPHPTQCLVIFIQLSSSMSYTSLDFTCKWGHTVHVFLIPGSFHLVWDHSCCCKWQGFLLFKGQMAFQWVHIPHFLYPFIHWWTSRLVPCFGYCECLIPYFEYQVRS